MSVIVMGVDIPEDCDSCWLPGKHCNLWLATDVGERHRGCPLRPLPEKHGRLIDADAILQSKGVGTQIAALGKMITDALKGYLLRDDSPRYFRRVVHELTEGHEIEVEVREL